MVILNTKKIKKQKAILTSVAFLTLSTSCAYSSAILDQEDQKEFAKQSARQASYIAALESATSMFKDDQEFAEKFVQSLMKGKMPKKKQGETLHDKQFRGFSANLIVTAARKAATEEAYRILKDENEAQKIAASFKFNHYSDKINPEDKRKDKHLRNDDASNETSRFLTIDSLNDTAQEEDDEIRHNNLLISRYQVEALGLEEPKSTVKSTIKKGEKVAKVVAKVTQILRPLSKLILPNTHN